MGKRGERTSSRRALVAGVATSALAAVGRATEAAPARAQVGVCAQEPGVQLLLDWRAGLPVVSIPELLPPLDWVWYSNQTLALLVRYPPDWTLLEAWADAFTAAGAPIWRDTPPNLPQLTLARFVAPTQDAAIEFAVGNIQGQPLALAQAAIVAKQGLLGDSPRLTPICARDTPAGPAPSWFHADYAGPFVVVSSGTAVGLPSPFLPATNVAYRNYIGPAERFEDLMRTVFLRILFQFVYQPNDNNDDD